MSFVTLVSTRPPWHKALLLWLFTNVSGSGAMGVMLLLLAAWGGDPVRAVQMVIFGGLIAAVCSLVTIPLAALLFYLLPRLPSYRRRQLWAALGLTGLFLLPFLLLVSRFGLFDGLLLFALVYWPAALGCAMYLYHPWLFGLPEVVEEPWV